MLHRLRTIFPSHAFVFDVDKVCFHHANGFGVSSCAARRSALYDALLIGKLACTASKAGSVHNGKLTCSLCPWL